MKWGAAVLGTGATVTYAVTAAAQDFPAARNCKGIVPIDGLLAASGVARFGFDAELSAAFAAWSAVANIRFAPADAAVADILIGAEAKPLGRAFTNVAYGSGGAAGDGSRSIGHSVICLNPAERWKIGFDGNLDVYDLRYTLEHEIGHAIGLDHPSGTSSLMGFRYLEKFAGPQPGDIAGAQELYGAAEGQVAVREPRANVNADQMKATPTLAIGAPAPR